MAISGNRALLTSDNIT